MVGRSFEGGLKSTKVGDVGNLMIDSWIIYTSDFSVFLHDNDLLTLKSCELYVAG